MLQLCTSTSFTYFGLRGAQLNSYPVPYTQPLPYLELDTRLRLGIAMLDQVFQQLSWI